jgi:hypothetical protein
MEASHPGWGDKGTVYVCEKEGHRQSWVGTDQQSQERKMQRMFPAGIALYSQRQSAGGGGAFLDPSVLDSCCLLAAKVP